MRHGTATPPLAVGSADIAMPPKLSTGGVVRIARKWTVPCPGRRRRTAEAVTLPRRVERQVGAQVLEDERLRLEHDAGGGPWARAPWRSGPCACRCWCRSPSRRRRRVDSSLSRNCDLDLAAFAVARGSRWPRYMSFGLTSIQPWRALRPAGTAAPSAIRVAGRPAGAGDRGRRRHRPRSCLQLPDDANDHGGRCAATISTAMTVTICDIEFPILVRRRRPAVRVSQLRPRLVQ